MLLPVYEKIHNMLRPPRPAPFIVQVGTRLFRSFISSHVCFIDSPIHCCSLVHTRFCHVPYAAAQDRSILAWNLGAQAYKARKDAPCSINSSTVLFLMLMDGTRVRASRLARLHHDLTDLLENPYPGVAIFTDDADIRKFCLVLTPPSGPWKNLALHFDVVLPEEWVGFLAVRCVLGLC